MQPVDLATAPSVTCAEHPNTPVSHFCAGCGKPMCVQCEMAVENSFLCNRCFVARHQSTPAGQPGTTQGVVVEDTTGRRYVAHADLRMNFGTRFTAYFIDQLVLLIPSLLASFIPMGTLLVAAAYSILMIGNGGQTLGMKAVGIRVVGFAGEKIDYGRATVRFLASILSGCLLGIGYLMCAFDAEKQTLHDKLCKTNVVGARDVPSWIPALLIGVVVLGCGGLLSLGVFAQMMSGLTPGGPPTGGFPAPVPR